MIFVPPLDDRVVYFPLKETTDEVIIYSDTPAPQEPQKVVVELASEKWGTYYVRGGKLELGYISPKRPYPRP